MKLNLRPILGAEVGMSLVLMQATAHHEITPSLVLCDLAISHSIYGRDRLKDQLIREKQVGEIEYNFFNYTTSTANLIAFLFLLKFECTECIPIVAFLSNAYSRSKVRFGNTKPFLIGILWAYAIVFLPPGDAPNGLFLVYSSLYAATSNIADIKDIEEDKQNGVITVPVKFGEKATYIVSAVLASVALATHTCFDEWTFGDTFIEIVSAGLFLYSSVMGF